MALSRAWLDSDTKEFLNGNGYGPYRGELVSDDKPIIERPFQMKYGSAHGQVTPRKIALKMRPIQITYHTGLRFKEALDERPFSEDSAFRDIVLNPENLGKEWTLIQDNTATTGKLLIGDQEYEMPALLALFPQPSVTGEEIIKYGNEIGLKKFDVAFHTPDHHGWNLKACVDELVMEWDEKAVRRMLFTHSMSRHMSAAVRRSRQKPIERKKITSAERKAQESLREILLESEWRRYITNGFIMVRGPSGRFYQLFRDGRHTEVFYRGKKVYSLCIRTAGECPPSDHVLGLKLRLEYDEESVWQGSNARQYTETGETIRPTGGPFHDGFLAPAEIELPPLVQVG